MEDIELLISPIYLQSCKNYNQVLSIFLLAWFARVRFVVVYRLHQIVHINILIAVHESRRAMQAENFHNCLLFVKLLPSEKSVKKICQACLLINKEKIALLLVFPKNRLDQIRPAEPPFFGSEFVNRISGSYFWS